LFRLASPEVVAVAFAVALATLMTLDVALVVAVADARMPKDLVRPAAPTVTPPTEAEPDWVLVLPSTPDAEVGTDAALASCQAAVAYAAVDALVETAPACVLDLESAAEVVPAEATAAAMRLDLLTAAVAVAEAEMAPAMAMLLLSGALDAATTDTDPACLLVLESAADAVFAETATAAAMRFDLLTVADATADAEMAPAARLVLLRTPDVTPDADTEADWREVLASAPDTTAVTVLLDASLNPSETFAATVAVAVRLEAIL
jgi:hypothetical protein